MGHAFTYDISAGIPAVIQEDGIYYVREPAGELIARLDGPNMNHYHFDQLGSTRLLTNSGGAVTDEYTYDAYGAVLSHNRSTGSIDQPYQYVGRIGYYIHWRDPVFGLVEMGIRYYHPTLARFTQVDSEFSSLSAYEYCNGGPTYLVDPSGRIAVFPAIGIGIGVWYLGCGGAGVVDALKLVTLPWTPNRDKLAHCIGMCVVRRCGTIVMSCLWGHTKEQIWDRFFGTGPSTGDYAANHHGEWCAKQIKDADECDACCARKYPVRGFRPYKPWIPKPRLSLPEKP